jgi:hypothetical protein
MNGVMVMDPSRERRRRIREILFLRLTGLGMCAETQ